MHKIHLEDARDASRWRALAYKQAPSIILDSASYQSRAGQFAWLVAWGGELYRAEEQGQAWQGWIDFVRARPGRWHFSALSYELKDELEVGLVSQNPRLNNWPLLHGFAAQVVVYADYSGQVFLCSDLPVEPILASYQEQEVREAEPLSKQQRPECHPKLSKGEYMEHIERIGEYIVSGDFYEINYCQAFAAEVQDLPTSALYEALLRKSPTPFSAYYQTGEQELLCASPERFLAKRGQRLITQPIKGTCKRGQSPEEDQALRQALLQSEKNRAENVMIVDLMRNDLAKHCLTGSVHVPELFGLYAFPQVWQMISTVEGQLAAGDDGLEALRGAWPMGSMTGAPKIRSMQRIEELESHRRGIYSGSVGYISPDGDYDWNVVIRSFVYEPASASLSFHVGGAIVYDSLAEEEYAECLLKAEGLLRALEALYAG